MCAWNLDHEDESSCGVLENEFAAEFKISFLDETPVWASERKSITRPLPNIKVGVRV